MSVRNKRPDLRTATVIFGLCEEAPTSLLHSFPPPARFATHSVHHPPHSHSPLIHARITSSALPAPKRRSPFATITRVNLSQQQGCGRCVRITRNSRCVRVGYFHCASTSRIDTYFYRPRTRDSISQSPHKIDCMTQSTTMPPMHQSPVAPQAEVSSTSRTAGLRKYG